jgi:aspartyl protease family protein
MRNILFVAIFVLGLAAAVPHLIGQAGRAAAVRTGQAPVDDAAASSRAMAARPEPRNAPAISANGRTLTVRASRNGHFQVDGRIDGRRMDFVVDTGATVIAIPLREAARLGIHPAQRDYTAVIKTANGTIRGAPTRLGMVEIGGIIVRDVAAVIMPDEALSDNLLGMSFLSRLRRFEMADGRLVLEH